MNGVQDTQERSCHVVHLALNDVKPPAHPYEPFPGLTGLLALRKENRLHSTDEIVLAMRGRPQIGKLERTVEIADGG